MNLLKRAAWLAGLALVAIAPSQAQLADKKALTLQIAKQVAAAAEQQAAANHLHMFVLIVDDGANLMYMERMDEAQLGSSMSPWPKRAAQSSSRGRPKCLKTRS
jgi:hypothetical protein